MSTVQTEDGVSPQIYPGPYDGCEYDYADIAIPEKEYVGETVVTGAHAQQTQSVSPLTIICCIVAAALLVMSLLARAQLTGLSDSCVALETRLEELQKENAKLRIRYESSYNLSEIEDYAVNVLGMQQPENEQIRYISGSVQDRAEVLTVPDVGILDLIADFLSSLAEYFR